MAYIYTPFMKKVHYITKRKRKSNVQHYHQTNDLNNGFEVAEWGVFCHSTTLQNRSCDLKYFCLTEPN